MKDKEKAYGEAKIESNEQEKCAWTTGKWQRQEGEKTENDSNDDCAERRKKMFWRKIFISEKEMVWKIFCMFYGIECSVHLVY